MKNCVVYESLKPISNLEQKVNEGFMTLSGCFGVCAKKNRNNRIYEKENYSKMLENINERIKKDGPVPGELEHPQGLNTVLENVSHVIEEVHMDEDGVISGTIRLLDTPKGKIAQKLVEGGCPLFISSRACGSVDKQGHVQLEQLVTYDLVGTPGFEEARMNLKESQKFECLTESLCIITEDVKEAEDTKEPKDTKESEETKKTEDTKKTEETKESEETKKAQNEALTKLQETISSLETKIEVLENRNENLKTQVDSQINLEELGNKIQSWIEEEYAPKNIISKNEVNEMISESLKNYSDVIQKWVITEFAPELDKWIQDEVMPESLKESKKWIIKEYSGKLQQWITEEFAPEIDKHLTEDFAPEIEKYLMEEFAPNIQGWAVTEFAPEIEKWLNEHFVEKIHGMIDENLATTKKSKIESISEVLNLLEGLEPKKPTYTQPINEDIDTSKPVYIQKMPESIKPLYEMASEGIKEYIGRKAQLYNFNAEGSIEKFWESVDFNKQIDQPNVYEGLNAITDEREKQIREQLRRHRRF